MALVLFKLMKNLLFTSAELRFASCIHLSLIKTVSYHLLCQANKEIQKTQLQKNKKELLNRVTEATLPSTQVCSCNEEHNFFALIFTWRSL